MSLDNRGASNPIESKIKGNCLKGLNQNQVNSLLTKNYMSEFNLIEDYDITFNHDGSKANIVIDFKEVK